MLFLKGPKENTYIPHYELLCLYKRVMQYRIAFLPIYLTMFPLWYIILPFAVNVLKLKDFSGETWLTTCLINTFFVDIYKLKCRIVIWQLILIFFLQMHL